MESADGCGKLGGVKGTVVGIYNMREEPIFIEVLGMLEHIHFNNSILSELWALLGDVIVK